MKDIQSCWRNQCTFIVSLGNDGNSTPNYPASYNDTWEISVGASGTDGKYYDGSNGDQGLSYTWASSYGGDVDLIAPGVTQLISTPHYINAPNTYGNCSSPLAEYSCFNGTSAAAPHVAGVASLLLSQHNTLNSYNNNLAPEDVEYLLETYASDRTKAN